MSTETAQQSDKPTEDHVSVLPPPDPILVLQDENDNLRKTIDLLTDQLQVRQSEIIVLTQHKEEILERLKSHEENAFALVMANLDSGNVIHDASEMITELAELVEERQEPGKLALTITMKPFKEGCQTATGELKMTEPKRDSNPSIFYLEGGKISRTTQRQGQLDI